MNTTVKHTLGLFLQMGLKDYLFDIYYHRFNVETGKCTREAKTFIQLNSQLKLFSIEQNPILKFTLLFFLLDNFIDSSNPSLIGKSFKAKYDELPSANNIDKILRQVFRIAKVIRNAAIHNSNQITIDDNGGSLINYVFGRTTYHCKISKEGLDYLSRLIQMFVKQELGNSLYLESCLRVCYNRLIFCIENFEDESSEELRTLDGLEINIFRPHYLYDIGEMRPENGELNFPTLHETTIIGKDYYFNLNGKPYIVPEEALFRNSIDVQNIEDWNAEGMKAFNDIIEDFQ